nr:MAG TPA: hypothetical protein [Caudoviricetes sp.]
MYIWHFLNPEISDNNSSVSLRSYLSARQRYVAFEIKSRFVMLIFLQYFFVHNTSCFIFCI